MKKEDKLKIITLNRIQCNHCGDILTSEYRHDFRNCSCRKVFIDGGKDYLLRGYDYDFDYTEMSEWEK